MKILKAVVFSVFLLYGCVLKPQISTVQMGIQHSGDWTVYIAPEWKRQEEPVTISSAALAADGTLWFGTMGGPASIGTGVYHFDGKSWTRYTSQNSGLPFDEINSITASPDGSLWFTASCCGVAHFDGKTWKHYIVDDGLAGNDVRSSAASPDGSMWFGTETNGLSHYDGKTWATYSMDNGLWGDSVSHIGVLPDGTLLVGNENGNGARVTRYDGQGWTTSSVPPGLGDGSIYGKGAYVDDLAAASDGSVWFATAKDGVYRLTGNTWLHYTMLDGLAGDTVLCVVIAPHDVLWFGTTLGISRFDGKDWKIFTTNDGLVNNWIASAVTGPDGTVWFGSASAIYRYQPSK